MRCQFCAVAAGSTAPESVVWCYGYSDHGSFLSTPVCQSCLDLWLDAADDNPALEPLSIWWRDGSRLLVRAG